jgi:hypothetical protein
MLVTRRLDIEARILALLTVLPAVRKMPYGRVSIMTLNAKSRLEVMKDDNTK